MSNDQRWMARQGDLFAPLRSWCELAAVAPIWRVWRLHAYVGLLRVHRWLWLRGVEV